MSTTPKKTLKVIKEYKTHHYTEVWETENFYCPGCGKKTLWTRKCGGDYYLGPESICTTCDAISYLSGVQLATSKEDMQVLAQLRTGKTSTPSTPKGN